MNIKNAGLFAALFFIGALNMGAAEKKSTEAKPDAAAKPAVLEAAAMTKTATVESIDYKTRNITLKGEEGDMVTMNAGPEIARFNEIKKGDTIEMNYMASVAVVVQSPDKDIASAEGSQSVLVRNKTAKPSATQMDTDVITATVEKVDVKKRKATLKGPTGNVFEVNVAPDVQHLENVKKGDQMVVKVTRALSLEVHSPSKKK